MVLRSLFTGAALATDISVCEMQMARPRRAAKKETAPDSLDGARMLVVEHYPWTAAELATYVARLLARGIRPV